MGERSGRIEPIPRAGVVVTTTTDALVFFDDGTGLEVILPKSQIRQWCFVESKTSDNLRLQDLERDDEILVSVPRWLWMKEGVLDE